MCALEMLRKINTEIKIHARKLKYNKQYKRFKNYTENNLVFSTILFISRVFLTRVFKEWLEFSKVDKDRGCGGLKNHD